MSFDDSFLARVGVQAHAPALGFSLSWACSGLCMLPQSVWVRMCSNLVVSRKHCFLGVIHSLWLLQSFCLLFYKALWALAGGGGGNYFLISASLIMSRSIYINSEFHAFSSVSFGWCQNSKFTCITVLESEAASIYSQQGHIHLPDRGHLPLSQHHESRYLVG